MYIHMCIWLVLLPLYTEVVAAAAVVDVAVVAVVAAASTAVAQLAINEHRQ